MKMKKIFMVHGWGHNSKSLPWMNWLEQKLKEKNFQVKVFDMPETDAPKIELWVKFLESQIEDEEINEETFFVGHSIGAQTILRFLEKMHKHKKIGGCVFIAPWLELINLNPEEMMIAHPWINTKIDLERIADHTNKILTIFSRDDPYVSETESKKFKEELGANAIFKEGQEHFEETEKINEALDFIMHGKLK